MVKRGSPVIYYQSLNRPILILGVDRPLFFLFVGLCLPIAFSGHFNWIMDSVSLICFFICLCVGRLISHTDSQMLALYKRHIRYLKYYSSQPGIHAKIKPVYSSVL